jgi:hypothetical protein
MRAHVEAIAWRQGGRAHVIEEDERPDHLLRQRRQDAADGKSADVAEMRFEDVRDGRLHDPGPRTP